MVVGRAENPDPCGTASHGLGLGGFVCFWITVQEANVVSFLARNVVNRDSHRISRRCIGIGGHCSVSGQKYVHLKASASCSIFHLHLDTLALTDYLSRLPWVLTMNARRFQRTHLLSLTGSSLNASKEIEMRVTDLSPTCGSEPVMDAACPAAFCAHEGRSPELCNVGDTRWSFSAKR